MTPSTTHTARHLAAATLITVAALLSACGGNSDPEPDVPTPRVDCAKEPEKCK